MNKMTLYQTKDGFLGKALRPYETGFYSETAYAILKALEAFAKAVTDYQLTWCLFDNAEKLLYFRGMRSKMDYMVESDKSNSFFTSVANSLIVDPRGEICIEPFLNVPDCVNMKVWLKHCLQEFSGFIKAHVGTAADEPIIMKVEKILPGICRYVGKNLTSSFFPFDYKIRLSDIDEMVSFLNGGPCSLDIVGVPNDPILAGKHETWLKLVQEAKLTLMSAKLPDANGSCDEFLEKLKKVDVKTYEKIEKIISADCFIESESERKSAFYEIVDIVDIKLV